MRVEVTPAVVRALEAAREWSRKLGATDTRSLHVMLALLEEDEGRVAELVMQSGTTVDALRLAVLGLPPPDPGGTPGLDQIIAAALALAVERTGERSIASEHVFAAMVREDAIVRGALEAAGVDTAALEAAAIPAAGPPLRLDEPLDLAAPSEFLDTARILDAAANRSREALRVIDDYARFALNDAFLCREIKTLRHDLTEALASVAELPLLDARDTLRDVGTEVGTPGEFRRDSPQHVAQVNWK